MLCTYNTPTELLIRAFSSFEGFNNTNFEFVIVNDGSDELHSFELIKLLKESNFHFKYRVFNIDNIGLAAARNYGLKESTGKYIGFVDSDDYYYLSDVFLELSLIETDFDIIDFSIETITNYNKTHMTIHDDIRILNRDDVLCYFNNLLKNNKYFAPAQYRVYLRNFLIENNLTFYEGILHEDEEWMPRVYYNASNLLVSSIVSYRHFQTTSSSITRSQNPNIKINRAIGLLTATDSMLRLSKSMNGQLKRNFKNYIAKTYLQIPLHSSDIKLNRTLPFKLANEPLILIKSILFLFGNKFYLLARTIIKG